MNVTFVNADTGKTLDEIKQKKTDELDAKCTEAILGKFIATVDGADYSFYYDMKAQSRFNGTASSFSRGYIDTIDWTAYDVNGNRVTLALDSVKFDSVALSALNHCNSNIDKYRGLLLQVNNATSVDEVNSIIW